jgi:hypothetical protein
VAFNTTILAHCDAVWEGGNHPISLIEPEDDGSRDCYCGQESVGAPIIACVDTSPVFKFTEHILDFVTLAIEVFIEASG